MGGGSLGGGIRSDGGEGVCAGEHQEAVAALPDVIVIKAGSHHYAIIIIIIIIIIN